MAFNIKQYLKEGKIFEENSYGNNYIAVKPGETVDYEGEEHLVTRLEGDQIYLRRKEDSHLMGKMPEFWVKRVDINKSSDLNESSDLYTDEEVAEVVDVYYTNLEQHELENFDELVNNAVAELIK